MDPNTNIIILAAGHGKRMQSETPKALTLLHGKPFARYVLDAVERSGVCADPILVVGQKREVVMETLGDAYRYAIQEDQLGTGHAVMSAYELAKDASTIMILYADQPLISAETIRKLAETHDASGATLTMATTTVPDFDEWRAGFSSFSRVIRDTEGNIVRVVEAKDASEEEKQIREVNPCYFCFDAKWMWACLKGLKNENAQKEYYLTDLVGMACREQRKLTSISIDPIEAQGVNTKEQLELVEALIENK